MHILFTLLFLLFAPVVMSSSAGVQVGDPCDPNDPSTYEPYRCVPDENSASGYAIAN